MQYKVIYADAPWKQSAGRAMSGYKMVDGKQIWNSENTKSRNLAYPSMTVSEICGLPIKTVADDNAVLFLWVTNQYLTEAIQVIKAWGFKYSTTLVWAKNPMGGGLGGTFKITSEFLIFATRGKVKAKKSITGTWFNVKREYKNGYPNHSQKPEFFRKLIEESFDGPYLELFARVETDGWDVFGNQVNNSIILECQ